jgi:hypothetical protein
MSLSNDRKVAEEAEAQRYAEGIRTYGDYTGEFWRDLNWAIVERWSRTALERVKARAWQIVEHLPHDVNNPECMCEGCRSIATEENR